MKEKSVKYSDLSSSCISNHLIYWFIGGAGGKGTWGKLGCELELPWVDPNDPNYESDGDENIVNDTPVHLPTKNGGQPHGPNVNGKSHGHGTTLKTMVPEMSEEDVNKGISEIDRVSP